MINNIGYWIGMNLKNNFKITLNCKYTSRWSVGTHMRRLFYISNNFSIIFRYLFLEINLSLLVFNQIFKHSWFYCEIWYQYKICMKDEVQTNICLFHISMIFWYITFYTTIVFITIQILWVICYFLVSSKHN